MRKYLLVTCLVLTMCLTTSLASWAKKAFISDSFTIVLYKEPGKDREVIGRLRSAQRLKTIETKDEWTLVRVMSGEGKGLKGWVLSRYLSDQQPWERQALILSEENQELKARLNRLETELNDLSQRKLNVAKKLHDLNQTLEIMEKEYSALKGGTEDYTQLREKVERLKDLLESNSRDLQRIREENNRLKATEKMKWLMMGALILLCGLMIGLIIGRQHRKRRSGIHY
ncbi:MAG: TIGR04211 family SH3 domain-containing protein [Deltaproteobacteria bacterium]|nr:TIGR04211 family SH3 domain-containing protein [Deltaproteobacteria bacterium]MBW2137990.1 TIGR04211 family SH3 domain-containing protein [Deltaproteobacteria bacterium]